MAPGGRDGQSEARIVDQRMVGGLAASGLRGEEFSHGQGRSAGLGGGPVIGDHGDGEFPEAIAEGDAIAGGDGDSLGEVSFEFFTKRLGTAIGFFVGGVSIGEIERQTVGVDSAPVGGSVVRLGHVSVSEERRGGMPGPMD